MDLSNVESPLGRLELHASKIGITRIRFTDVPSTDASIIPIENPHLVLAGKELSQFFGGTLRKFTVAIDLVGTAFQLSVWSELEKIPFGATASYGAIAARLGNKKASRAVGGANNKNPVPIIVPCHRVVGSNQKLVGYAGELWRKEWLLEHEGTMIPLGR